MELIALTVLLVFIGFPLWVVLQIKELKAKQETQEAQLERLRRRLEKMTDAPSSPDATSPPASQLRRSATQRRSKPVAAETEPELQVLPPSPPEAEASTPETVRNPETIQPKPQTNEPQETLGTLVASWKNQIAAVKPVAKPSAPKKPPMSLERRLVWGAVWVGAIALVMAGVYLIKEAIESGWLGPTVRVCMTAGAGLLALAIGEYLRKGQRQIAHGVTAAGVSLLYAALLGATTLHHLIPDSLGMVCMVGITSLAVALSLRHGPFVALLGLLGGFIMPKLLSTEPSSALQLFSYLILLQIGLIAVTRYRRWYWLMFCTFLGGVVWSLLWILFAYHPADVHSVALFLLASTLVFLFGVPNALANLTEDWTKKPLQISLPWITVLTAMGLFVVLIGKTNFPTTEWCYFGLLGAGCIVLARIQPRYLPAPVISALLSAILLGVWRNQGLGDRTSELLWICTGLGAVYGAGSYAALWRSSRVEFWGWISAAGGLVFLFIARYAVPLGHHWDWIFLAVAGGYAGATIPLLHRRSDKSYGESLAALIIASTGALAFAIQYALESRSLQWIWVGWCWSLLLTVIALLACRLKLRRLVDFLSLALVASSALLLLNPQMFTQDYGTHPIFNRLWLLFGVPLASIITSRMIVSRHSSEDWLSSEDRNLLTQGLELVAVFFAFVLTSLLIRHGFNPDFDLPKTIRLLEWGSYVTAWLGLAIALKLIANKNESSMITHASLTIAWVTIALMFLITPLLWCSVLARTAPAVDWDYHVLFLAFWVPAGLIFVLSRIFKGTNRDEWRQSGFEVAGWSFGLLTLGTTIRRGFHPAPGLFDPSWWEVSTYPLVWGILAVSVVALGYYRQRPWTRKIGQWLMFVAAFAHVLAAYVVWNPWFEHINVGHLPILNGILFTFGGMLLLGIIATRLLERSGVRPAALAAGIFTQVALFALITFEVRQWFHGAYLDGGISSNAERYCYSAAWILLGIALLIWGIATRGQAVRFASLGIMVIAVLKVFIVDMNHLEDLWRVVSFLGLGISLLSLVAVYHKFVFGDSNSLEDIERLDQPPTP